MAAKIKKQQTTVKKLLSVLSARRLSKNRFSRANFLAFMLVFACIGGYVLLKSHAAGISANVWMSPLGSDTGANCIRSATPILNPDSSGTSLCKTFQKTYQLASLGDTVGMDTLHGGYNSTNTSSAASIIDNNQYHWATACNSDFSNAITWQPDGSRAKVGYGGDTTLKYSIGLLLMGARCVHFKNIDFASWNVGDVDGTYNSTWQVTRNIWMDGSTTGGFAMHSVVGFKMTGGQVGGALGCGQAFNTPFPQGCVDEMNSSGGKYVTLCGDCENQIDLFQSAGTLGNQDLEFDGVTFHDVATWKALTPVDQHTACLKIEATNGLTIRNSKFYNCDSQTFMLTHSTFAGLSPTFCENVVNVDVQNNWFATPGNFQMTSAAGSTTWDIGGAAGVNCDGAGHAIYNWTIRNNTVAGTWIWGTGTGVQLPSANINVIGNFINKESCNTANAERPTAMSHLYNVYNSANFQTCTGTVVGAISDSNGFTVSNNPSGDQTGLDFTPTNVSAALHVVPPSTYTLSSIYNAAFGVSASGITTLGADSNGPLDIAGLSRPQPSAITNYDAGASEPVPLASVWVSIAGNDSTCVRGNPTKPCLTFDKAYQIAQSGDMVEVGAGTYIGPEYIYPNPLINSPVIFKPASGAIINIQDASGHGQPIFIKASHVEFDNFTFGYQDFAGSGACGWSCPSHTYGLQIMPPNGANGSYNCISDITIKNAVGHSFSINNGVSGVNFIGGTWGNLGWQLGQAPDLATSWSAPAIGGSTSIKCPNSSTAGATASNITFDGVHFGNNFQGCENAAVYGYNPQATCVEPTHPDCLHVFGETVGLHIENSYFDHCMGFYLNLNVENAYIIDGQALIKDALFENNIFGDDNSGGYDSWHQIAPAGTGPLYVVCDNVIFRNNTYGHNQSPNPLFAINCPLGVGASKGVQFYNNIFTNWGTSACPSNVIFDHNLFVSGSTCGTNVYSGSAGFVKVLDDADSSYAWAAKPWTADFHISSSSVAINNGLAAQCPSLDIDSDSRPQGTACDAGADEYVLAASTKPGDLNTDGHVNILDLSILLSHYGQNASSLQGDITGDNKVSILDLSILLSHYGT